MIESQRFNTEFRTFSPMAEPIDIDAVPSMGIDVLLQAAFSNETQIPKPVLDLIPLPSITVSSLLKDPLPTPLHPSTINLRPAESCVTDLAARWTVDELIKAPIPSRTWLFDLEITLKNKWHTRIGVTSVRHPTISGLYLPLWIGNFWDSLIGAVEQKGEWRRAESWILGQVQDARVYEARELLQQIPWGFRVWALTGADSSSLVGVLAGLLSTGWLRERHLDTLASYLNFRAGRDKKGARECWVGDVYLSMCLKRVYRAAKKTISADRDLEKYRDAITVHGYQRFFFPANLDNNHWIVFGIDLVKKHFRYGEPSIFSESRDTSTHHRGDLGDSLGNRSPNTNLQHIRRGLENWLEVAFGVSFKDMGNTLPIGRQKDGHSCGICVVNAIEHAMFDVPLFTDTDRYHLRIWYFVEAVKYLLNNVRVLFFTKSNDTYLDSSSILRLRATVLLGLRTYRSQDLMKRQK